MAASLVADFTREEEVLQTNCRSFVGRVTVVL